MAIIIKDNDNNKEYKLEYNRHALIVMEDLGFNLKDYEAHPLKSLTLLFYGAFVKNHQDLTHNQIDEIMEKVNNTQELAEELAKMYASALNSVVSKDNSKNLNWGKN